MKTWENWSAKDKETFLLLRRLPDPASFSRKTLQCISPSRVTQQHFNSCQGDINLKFNLSEEEPPQGRYLSRFEKELFTRTFNLRKLKNGSAVFFYSKVPRFQINRSVDPVPILILHSYAKIWRTSRLGTISHLHWPQVHTPCPEHS